MQLATWVAPLLVSFSARTGWARVPGPTIVATGSSHELVLPSSLADAVQKAVPGFEFWPLGAYEPDVRKYYSFTSRQAPWAVVGDFDGDGLPDVIVDGHAGQKCHRLCVWGGVTAPRVESLKTWACEGPFEVLMYAAPGVHGTNFSDDQIYIYADGYMDYIWEKAGSTWFWKDGKWNEFGSSD